jgi:GAF domain-containing protein
MGLIGEHELVDGLVRAAAVIGAKPTLDATLTAITECAVRAVPGAEAAGLTLVVGGDLHTLAATEDYVRLADAAQTELRAGPCLEAMDSRGSVLVADIRVERRWPTFVPRAVELEIFSIISFCLFLEGSTLGALNLYSRAAAFTDDSAAVGSLFASQAAIALAGAERVEQLSEAVWTRDVIGQAKGILIERHRITGDQAFGMLVAASQHARIKLRDVAEYLVETGELRAHSD